MQSLGIALKARGEEGTALPNPMKALERIGVKFVRSQLSLIAGAPGRGKSSLAYHLVARMRYPDGSGVPCLYFSADADRTTAGKAVLSGFLGKTQSETEKLIDAEDPEVNRLATEDLSHIWWSFETLPSCADIDEELDAYCYVNGEYPHIIVIDNLMNVSDSGEELRMVSDVMMRLKHVARTTKAHVMTLGHVKGSKTDGLSPVSQGDLMYNVDKLPELIITTYQVQPGVMGLRVVKNRNAEAASSGLWGPNIGWQANYGVFIGD